MIDGLHLDMQLFEPETDTMYWVVLCRLWLQMLTGVSDRGWGLVASLLFSGRE